MKQIINCVKFYGVLALLGLALVGCGLINPAPTPVPTVKPAVVLKVSGAGSVTNVLEAIAPDFAADTPGYRLNMLAGTDTGGGVKGIITGALDAAAMGRAPKDEEAAQNVKYIEFGQGGVAILTHPGVGVAGLSPDQLKAIFTGQITTWQGVGGPNQPIIVYIRGEDDTSAKTVRQTIMGEAVYVAGAEVMNSQTDMLKTIELTPYSIGYAAWPVALIKKSKVAAVKVNGLGPESAAYPMLYPQGVGYLAQREADVKPLLDWLVSDKGKQALHKFAVITP
jgi:phosphate transport system substrate-binding protein